MFCPPGTSFSDVWVNRGFIMCFYDTIAYMLPFLFIAVFGGLQLGIFIFIMMLEAFVNFSIETTIIGTNQVYGYLILSCCIKALSWIISIVLIYVESCKALPTIPSRGHGVVLLIFWTLEVIVETLTFISFGSPEWFWRLDDEVDYIRFSLWLFRIITTLFLFGIGIAAPGIPKRRYGLMIESPEQSTFTKNLFKRIKIVSVFITNMSTLTAKLCFAVCIIVTFLLFGTGVFISILAKLLINDLITLKNLNDNGTFYYDQNTDLFLPEPFKFPLILLFVFAIVLFFDGRYIQNGFLINARVVLWGRVKQDFKINCSKKLFCNIQKLSLNSRLEIKAEEFINLINDGAESVSMFVGCILFDILPVFLDITIALIFFTLALNMWFGILIFLTITIYFIISIYIGERRAVMNENVVSLSKKVQEKTLEALKNVKMIKYSATEQFETDKHGALISECQVAERKTQSALWLLNLLQNLIMNFSLFIGSIYCSLLVTTKDYLTVGDFILYASFLLRIYAELGSLGSYYKVLKKGYLDMEVVLNYGGFEEKKKSAKSSVKSLEYIDGSIKFEDVSLEPTFGVPLADINFTVTSNQKIGITGCMDYEISKFIGLFFKEYQAFNGMIKFDNQEIRNIDDDSLRRSIGLLSMDHSVIFNESVYYNLTYGKVGTVSNRELEIAATFVDLHNKILRFDNEYATIIGNKYNFFTDEELLRFEIARLFIKNPSYLIINETSFESLKSDFITDLLKQLTQNRTVLVFTNNENSLKELDKILVFKFGKMISQGIYTELFVDNSNS